MNTRKVLVTGASKGLGTELVKSFLDEGAVVTMCSRSIDKLEEAKGRILGDDSRLILFAADVTDEEQARDCVRHAASKMHGLNVIVNNAGGVERFAGFFELETKDWLQAFQLNTMSIVHISRAAHSYLKESKTGRIININSSTALQPGVYSPHYSASKASAINLTKHLANIMARDKILVNSIIAGTFESDSWDRNIRRLAVDEDISSEIALKRELELATSSIPLGRIGTPEDITSLVLLLASEKSSWTTGACFTVDGGKTRCMH